MAFVRQSHASVLSTAVKAALACYTHVASERLATVVSSLAITHDNACQRLHIYPDDAVAHISMPVPVRGVIVGMCV